MTLRNVRQIVVRCRAAYKAFNIRAVKLKCLLHIMNNSHAYARTHTHTGRHALINNALATVFVILLNDEHNIRIITFQDRLVFDDVDEVCASVCVHSQ